MGLAVDQLQYSNNLSTPIFHRQREQGAGPVAGFLIVFLVEAVRARAGNLIRVGEIDDFSAHGRVTRKGIFTHRNHEFLEWKLEAVVLRALETKMALCRTGVQCIRARFLDQIKGTPIGSCDLAGFGQNHVEQGVDIARF